MDSFLESFKAEVLNSVMKTVKTEEDELWHNHPPVRNVVLGCPYCEKYGNVFCQKTT